MQSTTPLACEQVKPWSPRRSRRGRSVSGRQRVADPDVGRVLRAEVVDGDGVGLGAAASRSESNGVVAVLAIVRSMPVVTCVVCVAVLLVSSASKIALFGSTVTVLVIVPTNGGATSDDGDRAWSTAPARCPVQVRTLVGASYAQRSRPGRRRDRRSCPPAAGRARRTFEADVDAAVADDERVGQAAEADRGPADRWQRAGHERAHTGSGESALVIVRSTAGLTVVSSVSVLVTPLFLMLPVTVAVSKIVEPGRARRPAR